jgi:hypothetical protein
VRVVFVSAVITPGGLASRIVTAGVQGRFDFPERPEHNDLYDVTGVCMRTTANAPSTDRDFKRMGSRSLHR